MNTAKHKKTARVALISRLPRDKNFFSYQVPVNLSKQVVSGDLVKVNFRNQTTFGIVLGFDKYQPAYLLKNIEAIQWPSFLTPGQLKLLFRLAEYYAVSLSSSSQLFIPFNLKIKPTLPDRPTNKNKKHHLPSWLIIYKQREAAKKFILSAIAKVTNRRQSALLLVPNIKSIANWQNQLLNKKVVIWHSELTISQKREMWQKIYTGQVEVIIGTRSTLFLPFNNLGGIIIDHAEDENYKQYDQNPRYDSIRLAHWLKQIYSCSLALVTAAARVEDYYLVNKEWRMSEIGSLLVKKLTIVDIADSQSSQASLAISSWEQISDVLAHKRRVLIWHNRLGSFTAVFCLDCKYIVTCSKCLKSMSWHQDRQRLSCHNCHTISPLPTACPQCQNIQWKFLGTGIQEIERALKRNYPQKNIVRLDYSTKTELSLTELNAADIIIGTSLLWEYVKLEDFDLLVITSFDQNLLSPEFRAEEQAWANLRKILSESKGQILLETRFPDTPVLKYLNNQQEFYRYLAKQRQPYQWPPFGQLLRLSLKNRNRVKVYQAISSLRRHLVKKLPTEVNLSPVYPDSRVLEHGQYIYHLLLKYPSKFKIENLWSWLPRDVIIDREPRFILS